MAENGDGTAVRSGRSLAAPLLFTAMLAVVLWFFHGKVEAERERIAVAARRL